MHLLLSAIFFNVEFTADQLDKIMVESGLSMDEIMENFNEATLRTGHENLEKVTA
jgi:hypothetical protein